MKIFNSLEDPGLIAMIKQGAVGVLPTDTVYGLVASSYIKASVERLNQLKKRENKPGTTIAATPGQLVELGLPAASINQVEHLWPNPVSVVIAHGLGYIHQGWLDSPFRVVRPSPLADLLRETGPLTTSSANLTGQPPAKTIAEAQAYFGDKVDFYVDGGEISANLPSTVAGIKDGKIVVYREGAVKLNERGEIS